MQSWLKGQRWLGEWTDMTEIAVSLPLPAPFGWHCDHWVWVVSTYPSCRYSCITSSCWPTPFTPRISGSATWQMAQTTPSTAWRWLSVLWPGSILAISGWGHDALIPRCCGISSQWSLPWRSLRDLHWFLLPPHASHSLSFPDSHHSQCPSAEPGRWLWSVKVSLVGGWLWALCTCFGLHVLGFLTCLVSPFLCPCLWFCVIHLVSPFLCCFLVLLSVVLDKCLLGFLPFHGCFLGLSYTIVCGFGQTSCLLAPAVGHVLFCLCCTFISFLCLLLLLACDSSVLLAFLIVTQWMSICLLRLQMILYKKVWNER